MLTLDTVIQVLKLEVNTEGRSELKKLSIQLGQVGKSRFDFAKLPFLGTETKLPMV